ncbi:MAG: hypothetical protein J7K26_00485 [Candidatus Aenigmarchaeota archaeon]|nr:hypothetical protein [Candidatus Aenigmarchaeota archaeon]
MKPIEERINLISCRSNKFKMGNKNKTVYQRFYCIDNPNKSSNKFKLSINNFYRILIPAAIVNQLDIKNSFIKIEMEKNRKKDIFITKTKYNRKNGETIVFINQSMREALNLNKNDFINILNIEKIKPFTPSKQIFINRKIDMKSLIPSKTMKKYNIFVSRYEKDNNEFLVLWYYTGNMGSKRIVIKRFIEPEVLGSILGQLQAEGTKFKNLRKRKSPSIIFTNKLVSEHNEFIENIKLLGIPKKIIKVHCYFNSNKMSKSDAQRYIKQISEVKAKLHAQPQNKNLTIAIQTSIDRAILAEVLLNAMNKLREYIANNKLTKTSEKIFTHNFLAKLLTGDGNLNIRYNKNKIIVRGYISDCDKKYRNDYRKILKNFGISVASYDKDNRVYFKCNKENLKFLYEIKAFKGTNNWLKLLRAIIIKNKRYIRLKKLSKYKKFTIKNIAHICNISYLASKQWARYNKKLNFIKVLNKKGKTEYFTLTKKSINFIYFIDKCKKEFELYKQKLKKDDRNEAFIKRNEIKF